MKFFHRVIPLLFLLLPMAGCAGYSGTVGKVRFSTETGRADEALQTLEKSRLAKAKSDRLLYLLEKGMMQHLTGDLRGSNETFESAEIHAENLFAISIANELKGLLASDTGTDYEGEDFERVLIHYFRALNYLEQDDLDAALVECRKADHLLNRLSDRYEGKNRYREDPLARYISGLLYEAEGSHNDAFIAYRKAYDLYLGNNSAVYATNPPPFLLHDLIRTAKKSGLYEEMDQYRKQAGDVLVAVPKDSGELVVFLNNGWVPRKARKEIGVPVPTSPLLLSVKLSIPVYVSVPPLVDHARILLDGKEVGRTYLVENIGAIAAKSLEDRIARIVAKTVARVAAKQAALEASVHQIGKKNGQAAAAFARVLMQVGLNLSEQADIRSWTTLPYEVQIGKVTVPAGEHKLSLELVGKTGELVETRELGTLSVAPGKKKFITQRSFR